jgi:hypothetical protein
MHISDMYSRTGGRRPGSAISSIRPRCRSGRTVSGRGGWTLAYTRTCLFRRHTRACTVLDNIDRLRLLHRFTALERDAVLCWNGFFHLPENHLLLAPPRNGRAPLTPSGTRPCSFSPAGPLVVPPSFPSDVFLSLLCIPSDWYFRRNSEWPAFSH